MQGPSISLGPFACTEVYTEETPIAITFLMEILLEWRFENE